MDPSVMLSRFVTVTQADPGLAQDLLEGQSWNWDAAMKDFKQLQDIGATPRTTPIPPSNTPPKHGTSSSDHKPVSHSKSSPTSDDDKHLLSKPPVNGNGSRSPGAQKKLVRGISKANARLVGLTRQEVVDDSQDPATGHHLVETPMYTFVLPDLNVYNMEFRAFIEKDLLEMTTMVSLENANCLNWWADTCPRLWPMATTGDGNCLLHAASLGMWGLHDRQLTLRKALYHALTENIHNPRMLRLKRRWRWQQTQVNKETGLLYSEEEWDEEWKNLLKLASAEPRLLNKSPTSGGSSLGTLAEEPDSPTTLSPPSPMDDDEDPLYESLEEFHVFVLANILQRPIIIVADTVLRDADGEAFAPIPFGGIYLPLDIQYQTCQKSPLVLTYDAAHFSALVPMERLKNAVTDKDDRINQQAVIPITDCDHKLLPLHFSIDPGPNWQWNKDENDNRTPNGKLHLSMAQKLVILKRYLKLVIVPVPGMRRDISVESSRSSENGLEDMQGQISRSSSSESEKSDLRNRKDKKIKKKSSFGSKLKFFSGLEKGGHHKKGKADIGASVVVTVARVDTSPQVSTADIEDCSLIVGAKMTERRHQLHDEMIRNYLERAKMRFDEEQNLLRLLENEASSHLQHLPRLQQQHHQRMNAVSNSNHSSQIGNPLQGQQSELPMDHYDVPQRRGVPNRYPANHHHSGGSIPVSPTSRGPQHQQGKPPTRQQQQPVREPQQVPESFVYVNRLANNPKHNSSSSSGDRHPQQQQQAGRHKNAGYSPPNQFPPGMRPATQVNMTSTDGRSAPRGDQYNRGRPVSAPQANSKSHAYNSYDVTKMQKSLPKTELSNTEQKSDGAPFKSKSDGAGRAAPGTKPCRSSGCAFYGTENTDYYCSKCYQTKAHQTPGKAKRKGAFWKK